jgi:hypothetical protein
MYVLINLTHDGDNYFLTDNEENARAEFKEACENSRNFKVVLCEPTLEGSFGFGSWGDFYGAKTLDEFEREDEE